HVLEADLVSHPLHPRLEQLKVLGVAQAQLVQPFGFPLAHVAGRGLGVRIGVLVVSTERVPMLIAGALHRLADVVAGERHGDKVSRRSQAGRGNIDVPPDAMTNSRFAALLWTMGLTAIPRCGPAQQLALSADVGQQEFFEDEPVYLLVRLQNVGTDTAWTYFFSLLSPAVTLWVRRGLGKPVEVPKPVLDYIVRPPWRGEPVPPGASFLQTMVLQDIMGDEWDLRTHLFAHRLAPGQYALGLEFKAHWGVPGTTPMTVAAGPIVWRIRARTTSE